MSYEFTMPRKTLIGSGALEQAEGEMKSFGKHALIVTGKIVTKMGIVDKLIAYLQKWEIGYSIFNELPDEPTDEMIEAGLQIYLKEKCDFCIGIGGGTPLDAAKAILMRTVLPAPLSQYMGKEISGTFPAYVAIPTTAGTGSETTKFTIITDTQKNVKMLLKGNALLPELAILDASFTMSVPTSVTAATGMDALTHAVEAYTSRRSNSITDLYAISAVKKIFKYLPKVYKNPEDVEAREAMILASYEAGVCINNSSVTLVHGMSRPIGALFHVPHGISNAMLIKECLSYVLDGAYELFGNLAREIGVADGGDSDESAAKKFIQALEELCKICEIPTLQEYGINKQAFEEKMDKMAGDAITSGSPANTIKEVEKADLINIYKKLWE